MRASKSLSLVSKDLVVSLSEAGCLATLTLDFDNSDTSTELHYITQVHTTLVNIVFYEYQ